MDGRTNEFIPQIFIRRYLLHFIIFVASLVVCIFVYAFCGDEASASYAEIYRFNHTSCREAVITTVDPKPDGDSFYSLGGIYSFIGNDSRLFCDAYMTKEGITYRDNAILFDGTLTPGECLISKNAAAEYDLELGDEITERETGATYRVGGFLTVQVGLDARHEYGGVILFSYNPTLTSRAEYANLSGELDVYYGRQTSTFLVNLKDEAVEKLAVVATISIAAFFACFAVCEIFLFSPRHADYAIMNNEGVPRIKLVARVLIDGIIKYVLPAVIVTIIGAFFIGYYGKFYFLPARVYVGIALLAVTAQSLILTRRLTKCRKIREA